MCLCMLITCPPFLCSDTYIILIWAAICSVRLHKYSANSVPSDLSPSGLKFIGVGMSGFIWGVSVFMCFFWRSKTAHYAPIEVHVSGILGRRGWEGEPNSRQGHVPVERANNGSVNPSSSTALWPHPVACRTLVGEDKRPGLFLYAARH